MKKFKLYFLVLIIFLMVIGSVVQAQDIKKEDFIDENIPKSWFEKPKTASELGISEFEQSPMLDDLVENGELPSVKKRLPEDPPTVEPYEEIGKYGGIANTWGTHLSWFATEAFLMQPFAHLGRATPDGSKVVPFLAKGWEYSDDYKTLTLKLRKGVKWSDGHPLTSEDYMYWWEHVANNEDLTPVPPEEWKPVALVNVEKHDDYTVSFTFDKSNPHRHKEFHIWCWWGLTQPKHYMKKFHPGFVDKEKLQEETEEAGFDFWYEYYEHRNTEEHPERGVRPTLRPYVAVERTETTLMAERNPYYPLIDTEGNQLPYIDKLRLNLANEKEMVNTKASTGEATIAGFELKTTDMPLYKKNEKEENYEVYTYRWGHASMQILQFNLTHEDQELRNIFQDERFRKAVSLGINRQDINNKVFYDRALPRQATVLPWSEYFEDGFQDSYIEYNPEKAKEFLDEIEMVDTNGDGYRETPDGEKFNPTLVYCEREGPNTAILELVESDLANLGINIDLKMISRELWQNRKTGTDWDMSEWILNRVTDLLFPRQPAEGNFTPVFHGATTPWPKYSEWYTSDGKGGEEPPPEIKKLIDLGETLMYAPKEDERINAGKEILQTQAEKLWVVGTVSFAPAPIIVSENLHNVPKKGIWGDDVQWTDPLYPVQFYLEE